MGRFKSDKQRKAVMAKLNQGSLKSNINPEVIKKKTFLFEDKFGNITPVSAISKDKAKEELRKSGFTVNSNNPNNDISKSEFQSFVRVRDSGVTNMFDTRAVSQFSGLDKEKIISIMKNFNTLSRKFPGVVK